MWATITDDQGVLICRINMAGMDLSKPGAQMWLGAEIAQEMGTTAIEQCAATPEPEVDL